MFLQSWFEKLASKKSLLNMHYDRQKYWHPKFKNLSSGKVTSRCPTNTKNQCSSFKRYGNFLIRDFIEIKFQMRKNLKMDCALEKINIYLRIWLEKLVSKKSLLNMHFRTIKNIGTQSLRTLVAAK